MARGRSQSSRANCRTPVSRSEIYGSGGLCWKLRRLIKILASPIPASANLPPRVARQSSVPKLESDSQNTSEGKVLLHIRITASDCMIFPDSGLCIVHLVAVDQFKLGRVCNQKRTPSTSLTKSEMAVKEIYADQSRGSKDVCLQSCPHD